MSGERFTRIALTAVRRDERLMQIAAGNPLSFLAALMQSAQLGLEPNSPLGEAYIIPYGNEVQFQIGYKGLLRLAYNTGLYETIYAFPVYDNDDFDYEYGIAMTLRHKPARKPSGEPVYYYAVYKLKEGGYGFYVMSREKIEMHAAKYSQGYKKGYTSPWKTDFDSMAMKTALKGLLKLAPKSIEFSTVIEADEAIKRDLSPSMAEVHNEFHDIPQEADQTEPQTAAEN